MMQLTLFKYLMISKTFNFLKSENFNFLNFEKLLLRYSNKYFYVSYNANADIFKSMLSFNKV